jgi:predicted enzyme related to lactoylglutathione lyase
VGNKITHIDIHGTSRKEVADWYGGLFDWEITNYDDHDYSVYKTAEGQGGGFMTSEDGKPLIIPYISVADLQVTIDAIVAKGGSVVTGITEMDTVTFAVCLDPFGNQVGLVLDPDNA